ncbi:hypothetical protein IT6_04160 [Methylacidiphilum caldifontis]|uniref:hypothetical protein n=1 Tax=Methylacidiphilum caldifontis TaxID=2795386 RepID=UPI001A8F9A72|nr:hypothetical protein [Methylacidiphilum caldifontis]QSR89480.1 hypothetical protein IT6_04160 [Methylacidiphilum caldifontis]
MNETRPQKIDTYGIPEDYWGQLDPEAVEELKQASFSYPDKRKVLYHLNRAFEKSASHMTVLIGMYRFYFYQSDLVKSLYWGKLCVAETAKKLGISQSWEELTEEHKQKLKKEESPLIDLYLRALHAVGYLLGRLGQKDEALKILNVLSEIDTSKQLGAERLAGILMAEEIP